MKTKILFLAILGFSDCALSKEALKLREFPAEEMQCNPELDLSWILKKHKKSEMLSMQIKGKKANFAGHYRLISIPLQNGRAYTYVIIDCLNGREVVVNESPDYYIQHDVIDAPNGYNLQYLTTSRLLIWNAIVNDGIHAENYPTLYFEMKDGKMDLIKKAPPKIIKESEI